MLIAHVLVEEDSVWLSADMRGLLIAVLVLVDVTLVVITLSVSRRQRAQAATVRAMLNDAEQRRAILTDFEAINRQHLELLAELNGHASVAFGRTRLTPGSRELLERVRGGTPGVDPAGERIPSGTGAPPL